MLQKGGARGRSNHTLSPPSESSSHRHSTGHHQNRHRHSPTPPSKRSRYRSSTPSSSSTSSSSSSSSSSSDSSDSSDDNDGRRNHHKHRSSRGHHRHHKHRRSHHRRHRKRADLPVPRKLRHDIRHGEFIVLSSLLSEHLALSGGSASKKGKATRTRPITGLDTWLEAWSIYAAVLAAYKPKLAPDLFRYQCFITRQSRRFKTYAWLQYDAQFRLKLATNPGMKWSQTDPELIATWLSADAAKAKPTCFACGNPDHIASDSPLKASEQTLHLRSPVCNVVGHAARECPQLSSQPSHPAQTPVDSSHAGKEICLLYNRRGGSCFRGSKCQYKHICSVCRGPHPMRACPRQTR